MQLFNPVIPQMTFNYAREIKPVGRVHVPRIVFPSGKFKLKFELAEKSGRLHDLFLIQGKESHV